MDAITRSRNIEKAAAELVAWMDEFVHDVVDVRGCSLTKSGEWDDAVDDLRRALEPASYDTSDLRALAHREAHR